MDVHGGSGPRSAPLAPEVNGPPCAFVLRTVAAEHHALGSASLKYLLHRHDRARGRGLVVPAEYLEIVIER
jgi:hypothetical protein